MLLDLDTAAAIAYFIFSCLAFCFTVPIAGAFHAWVAQEMGDDTAERAGFLSLNPLAHISITSMRILFLWLFPHAAPIILANVVPIEPRAIQGPRRTLRVICAYLAGPVGFFLVAIVAVFCLAIFFGPQVLGISIQMLRADHISYSSLAQIFAGVPAWLFVSVFSLLLTAYWGILFGGLLCISYGLSCATFLSTGKSLMELNLNWWTTILLMVGTLGLFITLFPWLKLAVLFMISYVGKFALRLVGGW